MVNSGRSLMFMVAVDASVDKVDVKLSNRSLVLTAAAVDAETASSSTSRESSVETTSVNLYDRSVDRQAYLRAPSHL